MSHEERAAVSHIEHRLPGARVIFSTRSGGVSEGPYESLNLGILSEDDPARVATNRTRLLNHAGLTQVALSHQVHGTDVQDWPSPPAGPPPHGEYDAHVTTVPRLGLLVLVADCLPVALAGGGRVAMLHCGWRGLAGGIIDRALGAFDEPPAAVIGPGIRGCCYEVGDEVLAAFSDLPAVARGRMLDLAAVARGRLAAAGVGEIDDVGLCTSCRPDLFFSHRRDNGVTGRQGGLAWLE